MPREDRKEHSLDDTLSGSDSYANVIDLRQYKNSISTERGQPIPKASEGEKSLSTFSTSHLENKLRDAIGVKSDLDIFYERVDSRLQTEGKQTYTLKDATDEVTKAYLINDAMKYAGNKSEIARKNNLDRKTIGRNFKELGIETDAFNPIAYNNSPEEKVAYLQGRREEMQQELQEIVSPYKMDKVEKIVREELSHLKEADSSLYAKVSEQLDVPGLTNVINQKDPNSLFVGALYASTLKEAQNLVRQKVVAEALQRNDNDLERTAEELDASVKTIRRIKKDIKETDVFMQYVKDENSEHFILDLNHRAAKQELAPAFEDIPAAENGKLWKKAA